MEKPIFIGIGGAYSGSGKTTKASEIIKHLITHSPFYPFTDVPKIGVIKYTKTAFYSSVIDDITVLRQENKDTRRLIDAGAELALWVQSPADKLHDVMPIAADKLSHLDIIIIEGNSAIEFLKPDIVVFIAGADEGRIKTSAHQIRKQADIIIKKDSSQCSSENMKKLVQRIMMGIKKKEIEKTLKEQAADGITCRDARKIAEEAGVSYRKVGKTANELKIKIKNCELGCF